MSKIKVKKPITQFDVYNLMSHGSIDIFMHSAGGHVLKGKNKGAVIEMLVDNDTFQNFAFQKTYGESQKGKKKKFYIMYAVDADEYEEKRLQLLSQQQIEGK